MKKIALNDLNLAFIAVLYIWGIFLTYTTTHPFAFTTTIVVDPKVFNGEVVTIRATRDTVFIAPPNVDNWRNVSIKHLIVP